MALALSTELLIGIQALVFVLLVIGMLILLLRRQKKTIQKLQDILKQYRDDLSGNSLVRHLQKEIDKTTANCKQDTVGLKPDLTPEDMAVALRYSALQNEMALARETLGAPAAWREQIKGYEELAQKIHDIMRARMDQATRTLNDAHNAELADKDKAYQQLDTVRNDLQKQVKQLKPLQDFARAITSGDYAPMEIEQRLHRALLDICENFAGTEKLRELVFLLHEAYNERGARNDNTMMQYDGAAASTRKTAAIDPTQNIDMLNNIINRQNNTIRTLRKQIDALSDAVEREEMHTIVNEIQANVDTSSNVVNDLQNGIEFQPPPPPPYDEEEVYKIIEQFTEESAVMVERIHLLNNENKQLRQENEQLQQMSETGGDDHPLVAGLKLKIERQTLEIIKLQTNCKDMEEKYLELYAKQVRS